MLQRGGQLLCKLQSTRPRRAPRPARPAPARPACLCIQRLALLENTKQANLAGPGTIYITVAEETKHYVEYLGRVFSYSLMEFESASVQKSKRRYFFYKTMYSLIKGKDLEQIYSLQPECGPII